jgi:hypothetical protein
MRTSKEACTTTIIRDRMTSPPVSPKPKRGVRSFIREQYHKLVRPDSPNPSQLAGAHATSPPSRLYPGTSDSLVPTSTSRESVVLHHGESTPLPSPGPDLAEPGGAEWAGLRSALRTLQDSAGMFPPLQSAVGALVSCLDLFEVGFRVDGCRWLLTVCLGEYEKTTRVHRYRIRADNPQRIPCAAHEAIELCADVRFNCQCLTVSVRTSIGINVS